MVTNCAARKRSAFHVRHMPYKNMVYITATNPTFTNLETGKLSVMSSVLL